MSFGFCLVAWCVCYTLHFDVVCAEWGCLGLVLVVSAAMALCFVWVVSLFSLVFYLDKLLIMDISVGLGVLWISVFYL